MLEGPEHSVRGLYRTIERDLRHEHCTLIMEERLRAPEERRFFEWGMRQADFTGERFGMGTRAPLPCLDP